MEIIERVNNDQETHLFPNAARYLNGLSMSNENFARYAGVSCDIFEAFINGEQGLTYSELFGALKYAEPVSYEAMIYPKLIYLDPKRIRHRRIIESIREIAESFLKVDSEYCLFKTNMAAWDSYFKTWFDEFENGRATYSGYRIRIEYLKDLQLSLNAGIQKKEENEKKRRGQSETIPQDKRISKPAEWYINIDPAIVKPYSNVTMYSNGTCNVIMLSKSLEDAFKECERLKNTTVAEKKNAYLDEGIYDEYI